MAKIKKFCFPSVYIKVKIQVSRKELVCKGLVQPH